MTEASSSSSKRCHATDSNVASPSSSLSCSSSPSNDVDTLSLMLRSEDVEFTQLINTAKIPFFAEISILYGGLMCVVELLRTICILPLTAIVDLFCLLFPSLRPKWKTHVGWGFVLFGLFLIVTTLLTFIDSSTLYHALRGQSTLKHYVIYNFLEIVDRLLSAIGHDTVRTVLLSFSSQERHGMVRSGIHTVVACVVVILHSILLFVQTMVLNVTVNSQSSALIAFLVSNNSIELKGAVLKRFDSENALQMICADACERCQLTLILFVVTVHNISTTDGLPSLQALLEHPQTLWLCATAFLIVWATECAIDWTKHLFVSKFNGIPVNAHKHIFALFCADVCSYDHGSEAPFMTQRLGYLPLSMSSVIVNVIIARVIQPSAQPIITAAIWYFGSLILFFLLRGLMLLIATSFIQTTSKEEKTDILEKFGKVSRWTMCKGRIPG